MKRVILLAGLFQVHAQCGPDQSRPYPPGQTSCPTRGQQMGQHTGTAPSGMPGEGNVQAPQGQMQGVVSSTGSCTAPPCAASLLGDVGKTTVSGVDARSGVSFTPGENIYGPFEAGFSSQQNFILATLGCATGKGYVVGGIDTATAESMVAADCGVTLPRIEGSSYISLLDECGGHTREYHFHERLSCLFTAAAGSGHSTQVGEGSDAKFLYGKWEDYSTNTLPLLDACGGHFGITPDSGGIVVYHYHVQDKAPFTFGCYGPVEQSSGVYKMVTLSECRALYSGCGDGDATTVATTSGSLQYDLWCPCYDSTGSNVGTSELPVFSGSSETYTCTGSSCVGTSSSASTATAAPTQGSTGGSTPSAPPSGGGVTTGGMMMGGTRPTGLQGNSGTSNTGGATDMAMMPGTGLSGMQQSGTASGPGSRGGGSTGNVHVTFGDVANCVAPPSGSCADYTISESQVVDSLNGFTAYSGGALATTDVKYYGGWWNSNVGTGKSVSSDFCTSGAGNAQVAETETYFGVTYSKVASDTSYSLQSYSVPNHDIEDYCSAVGSSTPPMMGTTFDRKLTQSYPMSPATKSRAQISNNVGWAVNGVLIFSPFTGVGTIAPYDETLDTCGGHPANGQYHYHGFSPCLHGEVGTQTGSAIAHSKIYGWAYDGFPIYGPYGYSDATDASSTVVRVTGGYQCMVGGQACSTEQLKTASNWAWSAAAGMLDDCNGRWTKTPEFPDGMYVYVLNVNAEGKPDFPGVPYCVQGAAGENSQTSTETSQTSTGGTSSSTPDAAAAAKTCTASGSAKAGTSAGDFSLGRLAFKGMKSDSTDSTSKFTPNSDGSITVSTKGRVYLEATSGLNSTHNGFRVTAECVSCPGSAPQFDRVALYMEAVDPCGNAMQYSLGNQPGGNVKGWLYACDYLRQACGLDCKSCDSPVGKSTLNTNATPMGMWLKTDASGSLILQNGEDGVVSYTSPYLDADAAGGIKISSFGVMLEAGSDAAELSVKISVEGASSWNAYPQMGYTTASGRCAMMGDEMTCTSSFSDAGSSPSPLPSSSPSPSPLPSPSPTSSTSPSPSPSPSPTPSTSTSNSTTSDAAYEIGSTPISLSLLGIVTIAIHVSSP